MTVFAFPHHAVRGRGLLLGMPAVRREGEARERWKDILSVYYKNNNNRIQRR